MTHTAFMQILWGLVVVFLDINLGEFDGLPDIIGYALIYGACVRLSGRNAAFGRAQPHVVAAGVLSLLETVKINPFELVALTHLVADALIVWYVCTGIMRLALERADFALSNTAERRRKLYLFAAMANLPIVGLARFAPELAALLMIPLVMFALTVGALILLLLRRASLEID